MLVSIVIPVKNGLKWLHKSLPVFLNQKIEGEFEIIILDSGSTDGLQLFLKDNNFKNVSLIDIESNSFNHGLTRNVGVKFAKGKYVVLTVQDAKPIDINWLQEMLNGFIDDEVMAVCGQQIVPHEHDKNPVQWFRPISKGGMKRCQFTKVEFSLMSKFNKKLYSSFDNVTACYRREALLKIPFDELFFAEDAQWSYNALQRGWAIVYNTNARVEHYHHLFGDYTMNRILSEWYSTFLIFGIFPSKPSNVTLVSLLSWIKTIWKSKPYDFYYLFEWLRYNFYIHKSRRKAYFYWCKMNSTQELFRQLEWDLKNNIAIGDEKKS